MSEQNGDAVVFAQHEAPYTDPGAHGQTTLKTLTAPSNLDEKAAGTPPLSGTHGGTNKGDGERAASLWDQEAVAQMERAERHTDTFGGSTPSSTEGIKGTNEVNGLK